MLGSLLRRLTGIIPDPARPAAPASPPPPPAEEVRIDVAPEPVQPLPEPELPLSSLEALPGPAVNGPVFSSRAVRDATVVTATIEALGKFVGGQDMIDDLTWRLESLTIDQVNFLQLSAEPGLIQRAQARTETMKGAKVAALRKLLTDLAGGAIPEPVNRANPLVVPKGPILPPLTSLQPRPGPGVPPVAMPPPAAMAPAVSAPVASSSSPAIPVAPTATAPVAAASTGPGFTASATPAPAAPPTTGAVASLATSGTPIQPPRATEQPPAIEPISVPLPPLSADSVASNPQVPAPDADDETAPVPPPPAHRPPAPAAGATAVPRLGRQDAEARRARLLASLNDTLSSSEAAP